MEAATPWQRPMTQTAIAALKAEAQALDRLGLQIITVIPEPLPADRWPQKDRKGEIVLDRDGNPRPAYVGKNPSHWVGRDTPRLLSHARPEHLAVVLKKIDTAARHGHPIGLGVIPSDRLVIVDLDAKDYQGGAIELEADYRRLIAAHPELARTRTERTPSGGIHINVEVADGMASWSRSSGGRRCRFTTTPGGPHCGEVLSGTRISVTAPTAGSLGAYRLLEGTEDYAHTLVKVPNLGAIGITPHEKPATPQQPIERPVKQPFERPVERPVESHAGEQQPPHLRDLLRGHAAGVLKGGRPYCEDRSGNMTGFLKELYGLRNWLDAEGLPYAGSVDELILEAAQALDIEDKLDRVIDTIDANACAWGSDPKASRGRYDKVMRGGWSADGDASGFPSHPDPDPDDQGRDDQQRQGQQHGQPQGRGDQQQQQAEQQGQQAERQQQANPAKLTTEQVTERLREAHRAGMAGTELQVLITRLAGASDLHPLRLNAIGEAVANEVEREAALEREALALLTEADRQEIAAGITLASLFPTPLADQIRVRIADMPYDDLVVAITFITTMAGLTKQGTSVNGNPAARFIVPTNLFLANVASSGRKKTPLTNAMVMEPTEQIRLELAQQHTRALRQWEEDTRGGKKEDRPERPRAAYALVNDYTGEAFASLLQEHDRRGLAVLVMRDELAGLFGSLDAYRGGRGADEQMLLELFDGGAYTSIRVRGDRAYGRSHVAILGNIQPAVLKGLVAGTDPSGKWARFLFCSLPDAIAPLPLEVSQEREHATAEAVAYLQSVAKAVYCLTPVQYRLEPSAVAWFAQFELLQQEQNHAAELDTVRALYGKAAGKVLRVAGLLHILERVCDSAMADPHTIRLETLQKAILLVDTLNQWAINFHADAAAEAVGGIDNLMARVHNASASNGKRWIGWRDFSRKLSRTQRSGITRQAFEQVVDRLAEVSAAGADKSRQADKKEPIQGIKWGESRRSGDGKAEYRAIKGPI
jgi:hypothetical protein